MSKSQTNLFDVQKTLSQKPNSNEIHNKLLNEKGSIACLWSWTSGINELFSLELHSLISCLFFVCVGGCGCRTSTKGVFCSRN